MEDNFEDNMYKEHIMELYRNPGNFGELKNPTHAHTETNTLCGDEVTVHLIIENGKVKDAKFHGSGCVMSMVSASRCQRSCRSSALMDQARAFFCANC